MSAPSTLEIDILNFLKYSAAHRVLSMVLSDSHMSVSCVGAESAHGDGILLFQVCQPMYVLYEAMN